MTGSPCPGGSQPKPGFEKDIIWRSTNLEPLLSDFAPWLHAYLSVMAPFVLNGTEFCSQPPPPTPQFALDDVNLIALGGTSVLLRQAMNLAAWYYMCECSEQPTPAPPTLVAPPGLSVNLPGPLQPCASISATDQDPDQGGLQVIPDFATTGLTGMRIVPGTTTMRMRARIDQVGTANPNTQRGWTLRQFTDVGALPGLVELGLTPPVIEGEVVFSPDPTATQYLVDLTYGTLGNPIPIGSSQTVVVDSFCDGQPLSVQPECCPPDDGIIAILRDLQLQVALLVARAGPAAELEVLTTTNIVDQGQVILELGTRVVNIAIDLPGPLVTFNPYANPDRALKAGSIRFGNDFGWRRREIVDSTDCLFPVPGDTNVVSYALSPGTSGRLIQLGQAL
jgi:hypothetical protein